VFGEVRGVTRHAAVLLTTTAALSGHLCATVLDMLGGLG
jgi:hypothetical protein